MANVKITLKQDSVILDFGDLFRLSKTKVAKWRKDSLIACFLTDTDMVVIRTIYKQDFAFCTTSQMVAGCLTVDFVDDFVPTNNQHLFDMISANIN